jgi:hypothetical protein
VTEDEDGFELTPALDAAILRTLGKIRRGEGVHGAEKVLEEELGRAEKEAERRGVRRREHRTEEKVSRPGLFWDDWSGDWESGVDWAWGSGRWVPAGNTV